jgi:cytochrome c oxidase subunit III
MKARRVIDASDLPHVVFGDRSLIFWGTWGMMVIEATMFAIVIASYFYLRTRTNDWPPGIDNPDLLWGTLNTAVFLGSIVPNQLAKKAGKSRDLRGSQVILAVMTLVGLINLLIRVKEFPAFHCWWDSNAYGSIVWMVLGLHTVHLATDWVDTIVLTWLLWFKKPIEAKRFMDVSENSDYWYFVIFTWLPIYLVLYFAPRWL